MASHGSSGKQWMPKLTLENYLNLEHMDIISLDLLRKDDLKEVVRSMKLMDAHHSTLQSDGVSSNAFLSLDDVIKDITLLHWQECCITSVETINSVTHLGSEVGAKESSSKRLKPEASSSKKIKHEAPLKVYSRRKNLVHGVHAKTK